MQDLYKIFLLSVCFFLTISATAQQALMGRVVDSAANTGLEGANLKLLSTKDSVVDQRSASANGEFQMKRVPPGQYRLQINYLGYQSTVVRIARPVESKPQPLTIQLLPEYRSLDEVAVIAASPVAVLKGDTTEFDAAAFSTEPYADADALVMQIP